MTECNACGENKVPVIYGFPSAALIEKAKRGKIVLGGCIVRSTNPTHVCACTAQLFD